MRFLEEESAVMRRPGPAAGVVVSRSAPSIDIGCIPWIIYHWIVGIRIVDHRCRVSRIGVCWVGVCRVSVGIGRVIAVRICLIPAVWIRIPSCIQPVVMIIETIEIMVITVIVITIVIVTIATVMRLSIILFSGIGYTINGCAYCN